jgi:hypothetical protein
MISFDFPSAIEAVIHEQPVNDNIYFTAWLHAGFFKLHCFKPEIPEKITTTLRLNQRCPVIQ